MQPNWDGRRTHFACFNIFQRGNGYYHYGLNVNGPPGRSGNFTARSVHDGKVPERELPMS